MTDEEALGALVIASGLRHDDARAWLAETLRRLDDAGYRIVPLACDRCGRAYKLRCPTHGNAT
jgi:hypothetical protein